MIFLFALIWSVVMRKEFQDQLLDLRAQVYSALSHYETTVLRMRVLLTQRPSVVVREGIVVENNALTRHSSMIVATIIWGCKHAITAREPEGSANDTGVLHVPRHDQYAALVLLRVVEGL